MMKVLKYYAGMNGGIQGICKENLGLMETQHIDRNFRCDFPF